MRAGGGAGVRSQAFVVVSAWAGMRNVEAGLGRGEGGSERIERLGEREGGVRVELRPRAGAEGRAGRTEGLGNSGNSGFLRVSGANPDAGGPFRVLSGREGPQKSTPYPDLNLAQIKKSRVVIPILTFSISTYR